MTVTHPTPIEVFCSYAYEDEAWLRRLGRHLSLFQQQGLISLWHGRLIVPGTDWAKNIDTHLETASVILLLLSANFLTSDYCYNVEMKRALERHAANEARVVPILVRPVDWTDAPFAHLQALPTGAKPIVSWRNKDAALSDIAAGIRRVIVEELPSFSASAPRAAFPTIWNVPYSRNPFFTGRQDLLTELRERLTLVKTAALTQRQAISGLGGIGKTQIALEYAYRYRDVYRFVFWTRAATREQLISDFVTIAALLRLPEKDEPNQNQIVKAVKQWFVTHQEWLLILDNADDMVTISDFIPIDGQGHILLTSRAQAMGALAQRIDVDTMGMAEGTLFLLHRAKILAQEDSFDRVAEELLAGAEAIVIAMDFLPLALDQAGAYIEEIGCGLSNYLELYQAQRKTLLQRRGQLPTDHPEPVATTWSLSFEKVERANPAAADLLRLCAFLEPDTIPEELISEGGAYLSPVLRRIATNPFKVNEAIEELRKFSLIQRDPQTKTIHIHRLMQAVLKDAMKGRVQRRWAERVVRATNILFPSEVKVETWARCQRYLPQAQMCSILIHEYTLTFEESVQLLYRTGLYLHGHALYEQAEPLYQWVLHVLEQELGHNKHPQVTILLIVLANLYFIQGKYEQAEPLYQRALHLQENALGPEHPDVVVSLNNLADLYFNQGKYEQAEPLYLRALRIQEQENTLGPEHLDVATSLIALANLYANQDKYEQAEPLYLRALRIQEQEQVLELERLDVATSLREQADHYFKQGMYGKADSLYQRALRLQENAIGPEHLDVIYPLTGLANTYIEQGMHEEAEPLYQRALRIREQVLGPEHPGTRATHQHLDVLRQSVDQEAIASPQDDIPPEKSSQNA